MIARTDLRMRDRLPCLQSPAKVFVLLSMLRLSGAIYLRLKSQLVDKISADRVSVYCRQVCVLSIMSAGMVS